MLKIGEDIYVDGRSVNISGSSIEDLQGYLSELKKKEQVLITKQNDLLSELLK